MRQPLRFLLAIAMLWNLSAASAQEPGAEKPKSETEEAGSTPEQNVAYLPSPLQAIRGNIRDLEETGYFTIADVELRTLADGNEALVWTVRVNKAITCRHIERILKRFRDVRFYSTIEEKRFEVFSTVMHYSERVRLGAANNRLLREDEIFELRVTLLPKEFRQLRTLEVDRVVFRRWKY